MKKRIIALIISAVLCISLLPYQVFANAQNPIRGISQQSSVGHDNRLGIMNAEVEIKFEEPDVSPVGDIHGLDVYRYQVESIEQRPNGATKRWPETPQTLGQMNLVSGNTLSKGIPVQGLSNGTLYQMRVLPSHLHYDAEGRPVVVQSPSAANPFEYVLTDFDTRIEGLGGSLEVTWEDTGYEGMTYTIGYIQGNYAGESLSTIGNNNTGNTIQYISPEDIKSKAVKYPDPQTGKDRFKYVIDNDSIATGQMYSAFVLSATPQINNKTIIQNKETPKVVTATTEIGLNVYNAGQDKIRLEWDAQFVHGVRGSYELVKTEIKEYDIGQESGRVIATLFGVGGAGIGYYEYREPKQSTYYQLVFTYVHRTTKEELKPAPQTAKVLYVPGELRTKPTTPQIPKPIGPNTVVDNKGEFLVPGDSLQNFPDFEPWKGDHTFHVNMVTPPTLNFVWSAYEEDLSLLYDIWVTDDVGIATADVEPIVKDLSFSSGQNAEDILYSNSARDEVVGFKHTLREYYDSNMRKAPLVPNKVYYIKIVAKKQYGTEYEPSIPATVTIMFDSDGEVFAPPMLGKPPLILDPMKLGSTSITIGWLETWYEIMATRFDDYQEPELKKAKEWNAKVYTTTDSAISFINSEGATEHVLKHKNNVDLVKKIVEQNKGSSYYAANYVDRAVNLGKNVKYEYKYMPYQDILRGLESHNATSNKTKTVEEYIEMLMRNETDPDQDYGWKDISPKTVEDDEYIEWKQHTQDNLKPNTSYVFFVKPYAYDYDGTKLQASLPTWVVGTTLPEGDMPEGKPTVPVLSLNGKGDTHISVEWEYNSAFDYEIVYSRLEDPDKATVWPFEIGTEIGDPTYVEHGGKAVVTITGLFPETTYNVWIRAKQKKGGEISAWSNPVTTKTDLLGTPTSPAGLGVASYQSILEVGKDFKPVDSNHITVEWQRLAADKDLDDATQDGQRVQKEYKYVIEIADNPEFIDKQAVTVSKETVGSKVGDAEILSRNMVYFGNLIANRPYYVRAKTILIAKDQENNREIVKESEYTQFIRIITKPSEGEYDGGDNMNEVIYPDKIEETFDGTTWIYTILDSQKVINEMVTGNQFRYVVPVEKYRGIRDAKFRIIRIPQPVVTTLLSRRMELEIRTNILTIQIPSKALETHMVGTTADGMVEFIFETLDSSDLSGTGMGYEYGFLAKPEKMSISVKSQKGVTLLNTVDALMQVKINMPNQTDYMDRNLGGYTYDTMQGIWKKGNHQFDKVKMQLGYTTGSIGTYAVYEKTRVPVMNESMSNAMRNVVKKYDVVGLGTKYTPGMQVNSVAYINIMLGIAEGKSQIKPDKAPTSEEINRIRNSGIYVGQTSSALTQEAAISGIVRLYELTHGISIRPQTNENVSAVSSNYRSNIQKAYTLGLISSIRPTQSITYEELFNLIEQVME